MKKWTYPIMHSESLQVLITFGILGLVLLNALSFYSGKLMYLPDIIWVLFLGLIYGALVKFVHLGLPELSLEPEIILYVFVPLLIFASTQKVCLFHFRKVIIPASLLASLGIIVSALIIALPLHLIFGFGWLETFLFGIIVSATDPLAVGALLQKNKYVSNLQKLFIESESVLNDGFVVTVYGVIVLILFGNKELTLAYGSLAFVKNVLGALFLGIVIGRLARWLLKKWHSDHFTLTVNITIAIAYCSFLLGELLHLSGILTVFATAMAYGYKPETHDKDAHYYVWEYFEYIANAAIFFMLGASFFRYFFLDEVSILMMSITLILLILSRFGALFLLFPLLKIEGKRLTSKEFWLFNFSGSRGAVSIALILFLPNTFVLKKTFLSLAFAMIFFSLVVYPLITKIALKRMR